MQFMYHGHLIYGPNTICRSIASPTAGSLLREQQLPARFAPAVAEHLDRMDASDTIAATTQQSHIKRNKYGGQPLENGGLAGLKWRLNH